MVLAAKPGDASAMALKAGALGLRNEVAAAIDLARAALAKDPGNADAASLLSGFLMNKGQQPEAQAVLEAAIKASPKSVELREVLAMSFASRKEYTLAVNTYKEIIGLEPKSREHRSALARLYATAGNLDGAEVTLRESVIADPADEVRQIMLADFLSKERGAAQAEKYLKEAIAAHPDAYRVRFSLGGRYRGQSRLDDAVALYKAIVEKDAKGPNGLQARNAIAEIRLAQGKSGEAAILVAEILKDNPHDNQALLMRGRMALDRGDAAGAITDFRSVLRDQPDAVDVLVLLAQAHLSNDESALAKETLSRAVELRRNDPEVRVLMAGLKNATGDADGALQDINQILVADPATFRALNAKVDIAAARKDKKGTEQALAALRRAYPNDPRVALRFGNFHLAEKRFDVALAEFESVLAKQPNAIEPLTGVANVYFSQGKPERAIERIQKVLIASPDNLLAQTLIGHAYARAGKFDDAEAALRKAVKINPNVAATHIELARYFLSRKHDSEALDAIKAGLQVLPDDKRLNFQMADLHQRAAHPDLAIQQYEAILKKDPADDLAANNLSSLLLDTREDKASHEKALELAKRFDSSRNPAYVDSLGWAYFKLGRFAEAGTYLKRAIDRAPESAIFQLHYGLALYKGGDTNGAKTYLQKAVDAKLPLPGLEEAKRILGMG
jgi:tetratricopeptide (TPR) repeat protein